jgi:molybdenum cofactor biosynthesis protein A
LETLFDNHGRPLNYLRLAVTDRCNLRCFYCMPEDGIHYMPKKELLTFEEIVTVVALLATMGISKIRLTGGEPFVRNDLMSLIRKLIKVPVIKDLHLTTNGILTLPHIPELKDLGVASINLSLDTLDKQRFKIITRRDEFDNTVQTLHALLEHEIPLKINAVVMDGKNIEDIIPLVELTRNNNVTVRFIEEMPFNGEGNHYKKLPWNHKKILSHIRSHYNTVDKIPDPENSTAYHYQVAGFKGRIGIIAAFSRTFCGTCNRVRITAQGTLKTCLYDDGVLNIKDAMRSGLSGDALKQKLIHAFMHRAKDGFEAEQNRNDLQTAHESMSTIGG